MLKSLAGYDVIYLSAITLSLYGGEGRLRLFAAIKRAQESGARFAFDTNFRARGWPDLDVARAAFGQAFDAADIVLASVEDLAQLFPGEADEALLIKECTQSLIRTIRFAIERNRAVQLVRQMSRSIDAAQEIQRHLLPSQPAYLPGFDISGLCHPSEKCSGDFFDIVGKLVFRRAAVKGIANACNDFRVLGQERDGVGRLQRAHDSPNGDGVERRELLVAVHRRADDLDPADGQHRLRRAGGGLGAGHRNRHAARRDARRNAPFEQLLALAARLHASGKQLRACGVGGAPQCKQGAEESQRTPANASVQ
jgi:hypothetical protein